MPRIATNIYKDLTDLDKEKIKTSGFELGNFEIFEYSAKINDLQTEINFILDGLDIRNINKNPQQWESLQKFIEFLTELSKNKIKKIPTIQVWIRDITHKLPINISFSLNEKKQVSDLFATLKLAIEEILSKEIDEAEQKIVWIAFDQDRNEWNTKIL